MKDPALGRTRAERALGEGHPNRKAAPKKSAKPTKAKTPVKKQVSKTDDIRMAHTGQYDGPKASYGRYNVGQQSADMLNRSKRNMDMR